MKPMPSPPHIRPLELPLAELRRLCLKAASIGKALHDERILHKSHIIGKTDPKGTIWDIIPGTGLLILVEETDTPENPVIALRVSCYDTQQHIPCACSWLTFVDNNAGALSCEIASKTVGDKHFFAFVWKTGSVDPRISIE